MCLLYYTPSRLPLVSPLHILSTELTKLNLPLAVRYTLMAMGSGLVTAGLDGPLPAGDIIATIIAIGGNAVLVFYWDDIAHKWDGIVNAFKMAFSSMISNIDSAFDSIYEKAYFAANKNKTVSELLQSKKGNIKNAPLPPSSPNWDSILTLTLAEVQNRAQRGVTGFGTFYKLLTDKRFNR